jgi:hypothetical protein
MILVLIPTAESSHLGDNYTVIKWILVYVVLILEGIKFGFRKDFFWPNGKSFSIAFLIYILILFLNSKVFPQHIFFESKNELAIFFAAFIFFYQQVKDSEWDFKSIEIPLAVGLTVVVGRSLWQLFGMISRGSLDWAAFNSFFGNNNMVAEYVVFLIPPQLYALERETKIKYIYKLFLVALSVAFVVLWSSRSAALGAGLSLALYLAMGKNFKKNAFIFMTIIGLSFASKDLLQSIGSSQQVTTDKAVSTGIRMDLLRSGWQMLKDKPSGIGESEYLFNSIPYQRFTNSPADENVLYKNPHNEFLRIGIEHGVFTLAIIIGIGLIFFYLLMKKRQERQEFILYASLAMVALVQALFQFPADNAFTFIYCALLLAFFLGWVSRENQTIAIKPLYRLILWAGVGFGIYMGSCFTISKYIEYNYSADRNLQAWACKLSPENWRACVQQIEAEIRANDFAAARKSIEAELTRRPFNFVALKFLIINQFEQKHDVSACLAGWHYDELFLGKSSWHDYLAKRCPAMPKEVWVDAKQYREHYLQRLRFLLRVAEEGKD